MWLTQWLRRAACHMAVLANPAVAFLSDAQLHDLQDGHEEKNKRYQGVAEAQAPIFPGSYGKA